MTLQETIIAYLEAHGWYFDWAHVRSYDDDPGPDAIRTEHGWTVPQWGEYWSVDHLPPEGPKPRERRYESLKDAMWSQLLREERPKEFDPFFKDEVPS